MIQSYRLRALFTGLVLGVPFAGAAVLAQTTQQPVDPSYAESAQIGDTQLDQFVAAYIAVEKIRADATIALSEGTDEGAVKELEQDTRIKMEQAVQSTGLTVDEYNEIATQVNASPELRQDVQERINDRLADGEDAPG
jgi:hypothetical protein